MSTEILYPQFEDDFDGFDEYVQCVSSYVLAHRDLIGEIVDIFDLVNDYVNQDDEIVYRESDCLWYISK